MENDYIYFSVFDTAPDDAGVLQGEERHVRRTGSINLEFFIEYPRTGKRER